MSAYKLGLYLQHLLDEKRIKVSQLARDSSLSRESVYKLLRGDVKEPDLSTLVRLSHALKTHPVVLLRQLFEGWESSHCAASEAPKNQQDAVGFLRDVTYPDNSLVSVNTCITKTWEIQNLGNVPWYNRQLVCIDNALEIRSTHSAFAPPTPKLGLRPIQRSLSIPRVDPGEIVQLSIDIQTPDYPCAAISYWKMADSQGDFCFPDLHGLSCQLQIVSF